MKAPSAKAALPVSPARSAAFDVLLAVERGGYASDLLRQRSVRLESRDANLASEIVFGTLRRQGQLDWLIGRQARRPADRLDPEVRVALRLGAYQIRHLDRVPAHAAVHESVELVKRAGKASAAGFANAVLRRLPRGEVSWPDRATALSVPDWMLARWDSYYGQDTAARIAAAFLDPPELFVRIPPGACPAPDLEPAEIPGAYRVKGRTLPDRARQMDIGSQSIVPLLDLRPGLTFLDLCAAPGNKTAQALELGVLAVACDRHLSRLAMLADLPCRRVALDAAAPLPFGRRFDRILADVPCSGTGTLARNPEIRWRLQPARLAELGELQARILGNAWAALAPGGTLVYSTCSLEPEENESVVETAGLIPRAIHRRIPGIDAGDGFFAAVIRSE